VSATLETPRSTAATTGRAVQQHPLWLSVLLHLLPGAALTGFIVVMHAAFGVEPLLALLAGILVVLAPLELGYLALHARRTTGSWSPLAAVDYRTPIPWKRLALTGVGLALWMIALVTVSMLVIDEWLATSVFAWLPQAILTMATVAEGEAALSTGALVAFLSLFFVTNGLVGPVTEELYFRGHLLPRIERFGRGAPVLNTALFTIYHFHTPWRYPVVFLGYLPIAWASWRKRSLWIGLAAHLVVNNVFVLMVLATYLNGG
jgi:membrane protease YdiL (CAAX protease family)